MSDDSLLPMPPEEDVPSAGTPPARHPLAGRLIGWLAVGSMAAFCGLCVVGSLFGSSIIRDRLHRDTGTPIVAITANPAAAPSPSAATSRHSPKTFGDGTWLVGLDIEPGDYRARVPADSGGCAWLRLSNTDGSEDSIVGNGNGRSGDEMVVTINVGDQAFQSQGCGTWEPIR